MKRLFLFLLAFFLIFSLGCSKKKTPLKTLKRTLSGVLTYSIILSDMKEEGNFFHNYYHKYKIVIEGEDEPRETGWEEVTNKYFKEHLPFLGMTIFSKLNGKESGSKGPPGYEYVGHSRYGQWRHDSYGRSFWVYYGQYRMFSDFLGPGPIYRTHYNSYNTYRNSGRPYYGNSHQYGTTGSMTKARKPAFYARRQASDFTKKASFAEKVNKRVGRTSKNVRSRSSRAGK